MPVFEINVGRRALLLAATVAAGLFVLPGALDPVGLPRLWAASTIASALAGLSLMEYRPEARPERPSPVATALLGFLLALLVSAITGGTFTQSLIGRHGRWSGFLMYGSAAMLLLASRAWVGARLTVLSWWLTATASLVAAYGALQYASVDVISWAEKYGGVASTMGNSNFLGAYLAIALPPCVALSFMPGLSRRRRVCLVLALGLIIVGIALSDAQQGPLAAFAGLLIVLIPVLSRLPPLRRRIAWSAIASTSVVGALLVVAALLGRGPAVPLMSRISFTTRLWYWQAAVSMWADRPVFGVGLDRYADYYRLYRPAHAARTLGAVATADAPHSVPLGMFAQGGLVLGLAYLALVGVVGVALVRGLRRLDGSARLALAGFGGAWAAYHVQSLVSIDAPSLVLMHFLTAGAVLAASTNAWADGAAESRKRRKRERRQGWRLAMAVLVTCLGVWGGSLPLRADMAAGGAVAAASSGEGNATFAALTRAIELAPWEDEYRAERGRVFVRLEMYTRAYADYHRALELSPRSLPYRMTLARLADKLDRPDEAREQYEAALALDPSGPEVLLEFSRWLVDHGDPARSVEVARRLIALDTERGAWWAVLAIAEDAAGNESAAEESLARALELDPADGYVQEAVATLGPDSP